MRELVLLPACLAVALLLGAPAAAGSHPELDLDSILEGIVEGIVEGDDDSVVGEEMC